jgi:hypothetical protein
MWQRRGLGQQLPVIGAEPIAAVAHLHLEDHLPGKCVGSDRRADDVGHPCPVRPRRRASRRPLGFDAALMEARGGSVCRGSSGERKKTRNRRWPVRCGGGGVRRDAVVAAADELWAVLERRIAEGARLRGGGVCDNEGWFSSHSRSTKFGLAQNLVSLD